MSETPPTEGPSSHPLYSLPHANRSASSYDSAENGIPDGPQVNGSTYSTLAKNGPGTVDSPVGYSFEDPPDTATTIRYADQGAIDLGDDDHGRSLSPSRGDSAAPGQGAQRTRGPFRTDSDDGGMGGPSKGRLGPPFPSPGLGGSPKRAVSPGPSGLSALTPQRIGKTIGARVMRAARRGNLPFLIVFMSCLVIFFSALAGIGYVPEEGEVSTPTVAGQPRAVPPQMTYEETQVIKGRKNDEQRELEREWAKKKRPKDGAWMAAVRDDKAIRRKPNTDIAGDSPEKRAINDEKAEPST